MGGRKEGGGSSGGGFAVGHSHRRLKFAVPLHSGPKNNYCTPRNSSDSDASSNSPYLASPSDSNNSIPFFANSPWIRSSPLLSFSEDKNLPGNGLIGSLFREQGHVYSLATSGDLLYTGSESKNIRVWKDLSEFSGFKSGSGFVKAIVISGDKIFTGHQDGKIRVWKSKLSLGDFDKQFKRVGSLPSTTDLIKSSLDPRRYIKVRRRRGQHNRPWIRHNDSVSCMSLDESKGILYSGSWDKTVKVWRISDSKCLESISAHDDAVNSVVAGFNGLVLTGSADGTIKVWRRQLLKTGRSNRSLKHVLIQTLLKQDDAVTALAVNGGAAVAYGGSSDGLVNFWEMKKKGLLTHRGVLRGHKVAVLCLAAAGCMVFSGSADNSICVWRRDKGGDHLCLTVLTGHCGPVKCLGVEEDREEEYYWSAAAEEGGGRRWVLYSGSLDKSVKVWRVSERVSDLKELQGE